MEQREIHKTLVIPVYKNEENIPDLLNALLGIAEQQGPCFEVVFVVDGSPDRSHELLSEALPDVPYATQLVCLSRNFGSFAAIRVGMEQASGPLVAVMAADLQEPPELIHELFAGLESGAADVVFGQRLGREDDWMQKTWSNLYWALYRRLILSDMPKGGVDIFACNERVKNAVLEIREPNSSLVTQLFWVGFRRLFVPYKRRKRSKGTSGWAYSRRVRYMLDSIFSYSDFPILAILWIGVAGTIVSTIMAGFTLVARLLGLIEVPGYTTLLLAGLFFGSMILMTQGIVGCYLWRAFENTKRRPLSIVESIE
jgi:glycosyltransferase involved in cell wall biosynthesis